MIKSMDFHVEGVLYYNSAKFLLLLTNYPLVELKS